MIDFLPLLKIAPIYALALMSPGPDFLLISSLSMSRGRMAGLQASVGIAVGALAWAVIVMFGLTFIFAKMQNLLLVVRFCGGIYLIYLGYQLWNASLKPQPDMSDAALPEVGKKKNPFVVGFVTNITNPKALAFFSSIFAVGLPKQATFATEGALLTMMLVMPVLWFGLVSFSLSTPAMRRAYKRWSRWIDRAAGTFLGLFGARMLWSFKE